MVMANINILYGTIEKLRLTVKLCFINNIYQKVLSIPKIYFMIRQILTLLTFLKEKSLSILIFGLGQD